MLGAVVFLIVAIYFAIRIKKFNSYSGVLVSDSAGSNQLADGTADHETESPHELNVNVINEVDVVTKNSRSDIVIDPVPSPSEPPFGKSAVTKDARRSQGHEVPEGETFTLSTTLENAAPNDGNDGEGTRGSVTISDKLPHSFGFSPLSVGGPEGKLSQVKKILAKFRGQKTHTLKVKVPDSLFEILVQEADLIDRKPGTMLRYHVLGLYLESLSKVPTEPDVGISKGACDLG